MKKYLQFFFFLFVCLTFNHAIAQVNYQWVKGIGNTNGDKANSVILDRLGNVYVTGFFGLGVTEFNPYGTVPKPLIGTSALNCFFAKYNPDGICVFARCLDGASGGSMGTSIAVDTSYNIYITGAFLGTIDFDPSGINYLMSSSGDLDGFVAKFDSNGGFKWVKRNGGSLFDISNSIAFEGTGNVYVAGVYKSADLVTEGGGNPMAAVGGEDIFFAKYDTSGVFRWAKTIGGSGRDLATAIAVDKFGNAYLTGSFQGSLDFDPGTSVASYSGSGTNEAIFFAKYDSLGGYIMAKPLSGSSASGFGKSIAVDTAGKIYLTGAFHGSMDFDPLGGQIKPSKGVKDIFYAKYNQLGEYEFAYPIGTPTTSTVDSAIGSCIIVDLEGNIYITGSFQGDADFNPSAGVDTHTSASDGGDIFFAKYDDTGDYLWAKSLCTGVKDVGTGIAVDTAGSVYVTGYYEGTINFEIGAGVANRVSSGAEDIFFAKYRPGGTSAISGNVFDNLGNPVTAGYVYLYTQYTNDGNAAMHLVDITSIQTGGDYSFSGVYEDSYLALAIADSLTYPFLAATYFSDSTHWEQADAIVITSPFTNFSTATINMRGLPSLMGSASLSGTIFEGGGYDRTPGTPIQGIPIGLEGDPGSIVAYTSTDVDGKYTFNNLPEGCYKIYVNIPALPMDSTYHECIDSLETITNLNFIADSGSIYIDPVPTVVEQIVSANIKVNIYPNPHRGACTIEFTIRETSMVKLELFNLLGEKVADFLNEQKPAGIVKYKFNAANAGLNAGIYLLNLKVGDEISSKKIIQIE